MELGALEPDPETEEGQGGLVLQPPSSITLLRSLLLSVSRKFTLIHLSLLLLDPTGLGGRPHEPMKALVPLSSRVFFGVSLSVWTLPLGHLF